MAADGYMEGFEGFSGKKRKKRTKESAWLGEFAGDSSSDEEVRKKRHKEFSKPMAFKKAGVEMPDQNDKPADPTSQAGDGVTGDAGDAGAGVTTFTTGSRGAVQQPTDSYTEADGDENDPSYRDMMPASFLTKQEARRRQKEENEAERRKRLTSSKAAVDPIVQDAAKVLDAEQAQRLQNLEAGSKGIGFKLLMKMGFKGSLGKSQKGIARPIEVKLRQKGVGLQDTGERTEQAKEDFPNEADLAEKEKEQKAQQPKVKLQPVAWKRGKGGAPRKKKVVHKTVEELTADEAELGLGPKPQVVLDMRGPQARQVIDMGQLNEREVEAPSQLAEMRYNTKLVLDMTEVEIHDANRRLRGERQVLTQQLDAKSKYEQLLAMETEAAKRLEAVLEVVGRMQGVAAMSSGLDPAAAVGQVAELLETVQLGYPDEYKMHGLGRLAVPMLVPLLRRMFDWASWQITEQPLHGLEALRRWRPLLFAADCGGAGVGLADGEQLFEALVGEALLPRLRSFITNEWDCRQQCEPLVALLAGWAPLLGSVGGLVDNVLDQLVLPKLRNAIEQWNPRRETIPIHHWTHPWLPVVSGRLDSLLPVIKHKLSTVLVDWQPADASAHVVLAPWRAVFSKALWDSLMLGSIVPKLALAVRGMAIKPTAQELETLGWLTRWEAELGPDMVASIVVHELLYRWLTVLHAWLNQSGVDLGEVEKWYTGWKQTLGPTVGRDPRVKRMMVNQALQLMQQKLEGESVVMPPPPPVSHAASILERAAGRGAPAGAIHAPQTPLGGASTSDGGRTTFKDVVEKLAADNGVVFMPTGSSRPNGSRIYHFGTAQITVDIKDNLVYLHDKEAGWQAVTVEDVLVAGREK
jgi:tuftelin-interacting protein 11